MLPPPSPAASGWCIPDSVLLAWCTASRALSPDSATLPPPWATYEAAAVPGLDAPPISSTALYVASLVPLAVLLYHRLQLRTEDEELLPLPLATAVASLTPSLIIHPAAGLLVSVVLNALLLLHLRAVKPPPAATSPPPDVGPVTYPSINLAAPPPVTTTPPLSSTAIGPDDATLLADLAPPLAANSAHRRTPPSPGAAPPRQELASPAAGATPGTAAAFTGRATLPLPSPSPPSSFAPEVEISPELDDEEQPEISLPEWSAAEAASLEAGTLMLKKGIVNHRRQGMASQRVHAPSSTVWERILDFSMWPKVVDNVVSARVYSAERRGGGEHLKVEVVIGVTLLRIRTFVHHIYRADRGLMTWSLDDDHESDLDSNCGFWYVVPDPEDPNWCTVNYSVAISLKSWAPTWLDSIIAVQGLPKAVSWVKRESEKRLKRRIQSAPDLTRLIA